MATTWKRSVSESSIASIAKVPVALLWCQLFRPRISRCGCILLVLGAMGFVSAVTISKSLVAWSSKTVLPKGAIHQADWGPATRYVTTASGQTLVEMTAVTIPLKRAARQTLMNR
ncbi:hypothetical protein MRX96_047833 [Rhipicephalus microplus]